MLFFLLFFNKCNYQKEYGRKENQREAWNSKPFLSQDFSTFSTVTQARPCLALSKDYLAV